MSEATPNSASPKILEMSTEDLFYHYLHGNSTPDPNRSVYVLAESKSAFDLSREELNMLAMRLGGAWPIEKSVPKREARIIFYAYGISEVQDLRKRIAEHEIRKFFETRAISRQL